MTTQPSERPNIIWVFGDQHRGQALGCMGDPNACTPNIDRLATEGFTSTAAVSGFPLCCPYRGSLLTGRYPHLVVPGHERRLPPDQPTIAHVFHENGYDTAYYGKWHLDGFEERNGRAAMHIVPPERRGGFDTWVGFENNNTQWDSWVHGGEGESAFHTRLPGYETDALTDLFIEYIKRRMSNERPFFAALSVQPPHNPYVAPPEWMGRHTPGRVELRPNVPPVARIQAQARRDLAGYYAQIENLDWNLGRILQALDASGLQQNTHVLFFSDHGDMHGSHGQFKKLTPWEESIRVPFIIGGHVPQYVNRSGTDSLPVNHVDIAPTTLGLCGIAVPDWMQGFDYSARRLRGRNSTTEPDSAYLQAVIPTGHGDSLDRPWRGLVTRDGWKYVVLEGQPYQLFNLNEDPYELANHALNPAYRGERARLQARLLAWINDTGDQFTLPEI